MKACCTIIFTVMGLTGFAQNSSSQFNLYGSSDLKNGDKITLEYNGVKDSAIVKDGTFKFSGYLDEPVLASLKHGQTNAFEGPKSVRVFLEPHDMRLTVFNGQFFKAKLLGSLSQADWDNVRLKDKSDKVQDDIEKLDRYMLEKGASDSLKNNLKLKYEEKAKLFEEVARNKMVFIRNNPDSYLSPFLLTSTMSSLSKDSVLFYYRSFSAPVLNSTWGRVVYKTLGYDESSQLGKLAPDFSARLSNGSILKLSEFKSRQYLLLGFWGTWCIHCRELSPDLIKIYQKYKSKGLEILSVASDNDRKLWLKTIADDRTGLWKHALLGDVSKNSTGADLTVQYNLAGYPTFILIDKEGKIVGRYSGNGFYVDLKSKLKEIFE